jgi:hypothetical protein
MSSTSIWNTGMHSVVDFFPRAPNYVNNTTCAISVASAIQIPVGAAYVRLTGDVDFYVRWGSSAASTAPASDGTGSERVNVQAGGIQRNIVSSAGTTAISVITTSASAIVTASWWTA